MSKLYSLYKNLKEEKKDTIYLFKGGIFYIALDDDAIFLSNKFNFKLTNLNDSIVKCGFPISSVEKYIKIFTYNNIDFKLIDSSSNTMYLPKDYKVDNDIQELLNLIILINPNDMSVSQVYDFINIIKEKSENIKNAF